uniref:Origin recognition complex subunit 2 n=1 Tax=Phallusia mammillata TaxID=59560 RepID=A0A6F9DMC4_9ASCI|nr:origin recognition complex subunit 2-like [Phallusia mammillata]
MCLRNLKAQTVLSQLALCSRIHLVASIDHINAPLIWDQTMLSRFNWLWYDVTTFSPYREETSYEGSLLLSGAGTGLGARGAALALSGLLHVARSLTSNARGVFQILAEHQISLEKEKGDENEDATYEDLSFSELYQKCRERFLVNSELTLRAHLTEFLDHKLVQMRKGADGGEYLSVPLDIGTLKEYLEKEESR